MSSDSDVKVGDLVRRAPKRGWRRSGNPLGRVTDLYRGTDGKFWARISPTARTEGWTSAWPVKLLEVMDETRED